MQALTREIRETFDKALSDFLFLKISSLSDGISSTMELQSLLKEILPDKVALPGTERYERSNNAYFTKFESALKPAIIAQPTTAADVCTLIKALRPRLVRQEVIVAIKGTGHTPFAGSANIEDGLTIELRGLKGIQLAEDKSYVTIGVGETWGSVYEELGKYNLTVAGGRDARVGVGGLILGGKSIISTCTNDVARVN